MDIIIVYRLQSSSSTRKKKKKGEMSQDAARWLGYKWVVEWLVGRGRGWAI